MSHSRLEKTLRFTERMVEMVEEIQAQVGYPTFYFRNLCRSCGFLQETGTNSQGV